MKPDKRHLRDLDKIEKILRQTGNSNLVLALNIATTGYRSGSLRLSHFRDVNQNRSVEIYLKLDWRPMEWGCAMAGEAGEACNILKKIQRDGQTPQLVRKLGKELYDTFAYADLIGNEFNIDFDKAFPQKFNEVSRRRKSTIRL